MEQLLDLGSQPPSNRFAAIGVVHSDSHPLVLGQCVECGLVQLIAPMPAEMVRSRYEWIRYNEPEGHLDDLVRQLAGAIGTGAQIAGLTYKDQSTIDRFRRLGYSNSNCFDAEADLGISDSCAGLETIQSAINRGLVDRLEKKYGQVDLLLVRHVLEHVHQPRDFLLALSRLLRPGGHLVIEVPDSRKFIKACDYSFIWEEHITYFSQRTLEDFANRNGFEVRDIFVYPYPYEDSLVAVLLTDTSAPQSVHAEVKEAEEEAGRNFGARFVAVRNGYQRFLASQRQAGKRVALFGAGHLAVKFLNFFQLASYVDAVIDDHPQKMGMVMPGSSIPIISSTRLAEFDLCLLSLSPESEAKVTEKHSAYIAGGGAFASIFTLSPRALKLA